MPSRVMSLLGKSSKPQLVPAVLKDHKFATSAGDIAEAFAEYYGELYAPKPSSPSPALEGKIMKLRNRTRKELEAPPTPIEVAMALEATNKQSAPGLDGIPYSVWMGSKEALQALTLLIGRV